MTDLLVWLQGSGMTGFYIAAFILGAAHALEPGHGKTVVAAYLVGSKGRAYEAILLGLIVTFTHTFSVIVLAFVAKLAASSYSEAELHMYLGLVAAVLILAVGISMLISRWRAVHRLRHHGHGGHGHSHGGSCCGHDHHAQGDSHDHPHEQSHDEDAEGHTHPHPHDDDSDGHAHPHPHGHSHGGHSHASHQHEYPLTFGKAAHAHPHDEGDHDHGDHDHPHSHDAHDHDEPHVHPHPHEEVEVIHDHPPILEHEWEHKHLHEHSHGGIKHTHYAPAPGEKLSLWKLFALGISGGLVPCPAAFALLLAAVSAGALAKGVTLVLIFSAGLAATLIAIGIGVVKAAKFSNRFFDTEKIAPYVALGSAVLVTVIGVVTMYGSVVEIMKVK